MKEPTDDGKLLEHQRREWRWPLWIEIGDIIDKCKIFAENIDNAEGMLSFAASVGQVICDVGATPEEKEALAKLRHLHASFRALRAQILDKQTMNYVFTKTATAVRKVSIPA